MAYEQEVATASAQYGVDPNLIQAVIQQESRGNPNAKSSAGAMGLMQLMPTTFNSLGVGSDAYDPQTNINAGTKYLSQLLSQSGGDVETALASYYAGSGNVAKYGKEKYSNYYQGVLSKYQSTESVNNVVSSVAGAMGGAVSSVVSGQDTNVLSAFIGSGVGAVAGGQNDVKTIGNNLLKVFSILALIIAGVVFFSMSVLDKSAISNLKTDIVKAVM